MYECVRVCSYVDDGASREQSAQIRLLPLLQAMKTRKCDSPPIQTKTGLGVSDGILRVLCLEKQFTERTSLAKRPGSRDRFGVR